MVRCVWMTYARLFGLCSLVCVMVVRSELGRVVKNRTGHGREEYRVCPYDGSGGCEDAYEYRYVDSRLMGKEFCCVDVNLWMCRLRRAMWVRANLVKGSS